MALLRTAQEALANVAKHAAASRVGLTLSYLADLVTLDVRDDGVGFDPDGVRRDGDGGFGLTVMRQRVGRLADPGDRVRRAPAPPCSPASWPSQGAARWLRSRSAS